MAGYANPNALVETEWVASHLNDPTIGILEVSVDPAAFQQGHIPGAVALDWFKDLEQHPIRDIASRTKIERLLGEAGVANDTTVLLYGDNHNWFAAYAYWLIKYYGHQDVRIINGGRKKWVDEGRPLTKGVPKATPTTYKAQDPTTSIRALREYVIAVVGAAGRSLLETGQVRRYLVDTRSPREFSGELLAPEHLPQEGAYRGGHIPGAVNIPWEEAAAPNGTFKSADELRRLYEGRRITPDKEIIVYCRIGERSAHTWFVLTELLGYPNVRNYDGSWIEYGNLIGVPIEKP
jgi:thiosulfate/3-mercaptopyruvate sulfurtransferase